MIKRTHLLTEITSEIEKCDGYYKFWVNRAVVVKLFFMRDGLLRIKVDFENVGEQGVVEIDSGEESYGVILTAWDDRFDSLLAKYRTKIDPLKNITYQNLQEYHLFKTSKLQIKFMKNPFGMEIYDYEGNKLHSDIIGKAMLQDIKGRVYHYSEHNQNSDCYYGFGESTGSFNKRHQRIYQCPKDALGYDAQKSAPLYKHIPFYVRFNKQNKKATGYFYDNSYPSYFDMGSERSGYWPRYSYFCADGGNIDLYFMYGPTIKQVVSTYTDITGKTAMCPLDALGYLGSTMVYAELPEKCDEAILDFVNLCKKSNIPVNNFHLSSGYTAHEQLQKRFVFYWNKARFPQPSNFFKQMKDEGVSVSPNIKPGILDLHPLYPQFDKNQAFIKKADGKDSYIDRWWGGPGSFVDFTSKNGREVWKKYLKQQIIEKGTFSIWNDNNEYESLSDLGACCDFDGSSATIQRMKPLQSLLMSHIAIQSLEEVNQNIRPYVISRSGYAGIQRYASTWSGDNYTSWKTIKYNIATVLNMGLSGVANYGCDIGGFWGPSPDQELFVRWVQHGIFQPRFSIHSCNSNNTVTEPWMFEKSTPLISQAIRFRYSMMPYLYSLLYQAHANGSPMMRPLIYEFQQDLKCCNESENFMLGPFLLIANVLTPLQQSKSKKVYLPQGSDWFDFAVPYRRYKGGSTLEIPVTISSIPLFLKENSIIPFADNYNDTRNNFTQINLVITIGKSLKNKQLNAFQLYEDDRFSNEYQKGVFKKTRISLHSDTDLKCLKFEKTGSYQTNIQFWMITIIGLDKAPVWMQVNTKNSDRIPIKFHLHKNKWQQTVKNSNGFFYDHSSQSTKLKLQNYNEDFSITISTSSMIQFKKEYTKVQKGEKKQ